MLNEAITLGMKEGLGLGRIARPLHQSSAPVSEPGHQPPGHRLIGTSVTVHVAVGTDIIHASVRRRRQRSAQDHCSISPSGRCGPRARRAGYTPTWDPPSSCRKCSESRAAGISISATSLTNITTVNMVYALSSHDQRRAAPTQKQGYALTGHHEIMVRCWPRRSLEELSGRWNQSGEYFILIRRRITQMSMAPSAEPLLTIWADLNRRYFHDALPPIRITEWMATDLVCRHVCLPGRSGDIPSLTPSTSDQTTTLHQAVIGPPLSSGPKLDRETMTTLAHEMIPSVAIRHPRVARITVNDFRPRWRA